MSVISLLVFAVAFLGRAPIPEQMNQPVIHAVSVIQVIPILQTAGKVTAYDTAKARIFFFENKTMYDLMYKHQYQNDRKIDTTENRHHYYIFNNDSLYGYDYDEHKTPVKRRIRRDSAFRQEWIEQTKLYATFSMNDCKLLASKRNADSGTLHETFEVRNKMDTAFKSYCFISYTEKLEWLHLRYTRELDSMKNMRVFNAEIYTPKQYWKTYNLNLDAYSYSISIIELAFAGKELADVRKYFNSN